MLIIFFKYFYQHQINQINEAIYINVTSITVIIFYRFDLYNNDHNAAGPTRECVLAGDIGLP